MEEEKVYSNSSIDIKKLLEQNYIVVCDTNVYLGLYRNSPDYALFALECLKQIQKSIVLPNTVSVEFFKHNKKMFAAHQSRIDNLAKEAVELIRNQNVKLQNVWRTFINKRFPDVENCTEKIDCKYRELEDLVIGYFQDHKILDTLRSDWNEDRAEKFILRCIENGQKMTSLDQDVLYSICEEGERRYKNKTPPGFQDEKTKDGIRKYSDLILWKEILSYAKEHKMNVIFVTDDVKSDWWNAGEKIEFLPQLVSEFVKETRYKHKKDDQDPVELQIIPFISSDFFMAISESFGIDIPDAVEEALKITLDDYINGIKDRVFESFQDDLAYSEWKYVDSGVLTDYGEEFCDEWEIEDYDLQHYSMEERYEDEIVYKLEYSIEMSGKSFAYWGRDDDTKEVILSPAYTHTVKGVITVYVYRTANMLTDFEDSFDFDSVEIIDSEFEEIGYESPYEGEIPDDWESYTTGPECGETISFDNDACNGKCIKCTNNE